MMNKIKIVLFSMLLIVAFSSLGYAAETDTSFENEEITQTNDRLSYGKNFPYVIHPQMYSFELSTNEAHTGERSLDVTSYEYNMPVYFEFDVEPDTLYEFTAFMKSHADYTRASVSIQDKTGDSNPAYILTDGFYTSRPLTCYKMTDYGLSEGINTNASRSEWTKITRYIYIPADKISVKVGIVNNAETKTGRFYIDDVTLTKADPNLLKAEMVAGPGKINSATAGEYTYNADLLFKDRCVSYYNEASTYSKPRVSYRLAEQTNGVSIDDGTGVLSVAEGIIANVIVVADLSFYRYTTTVSKSVEITSKPIPEITGIESDKAIDFDKDTYNYYDIEVGYGETPEIEVTSRSTYVIENLDGIVKGVRVTAKEGTDEKIYNFYTINPETRYDNMVADGDFELGIGASDFTGGKCDVVYLQGAYSGDYSAKVELGTYANTTRNVTLTPGKYYIVSFMVRMEDYVKTTDGGSKPNVDLYVGEGVNYYDSDFTLKKGVGKLRAYLAKDEWIRLTTIITLPEDATIQTNVEIGLLSDSGDFTGYIDDFYVAELSGNEDFERVVSKDTFNLLNYQNKTLAKPLVNVLIKGKSDTENLQVIAAEYTEDGRLISVKTEKISADGTHLIEVPQGTNKQKIFLWDMNTLNPSANHLEK